MIEKIGEGGMGTVYKGHQESLDRPVAIKVLSEKLTDRNDVLERFDRESLIIARLNHPNIIHIIDRGITPEGLPYFVMEYVEGTDLSQAIGEGALDTNRKLDLTIQVCKALSYAHSNGVIHRDIKPANVLIDTNGNALVLDFGIAKLFDREWSSGEITQTEMVMGTLAYMAPEQIVASNRVTVASDLYSLGTVMYELFTGVKPLGNFKPPAAIDSSIPKPLEKVILRCLEPDPSDRFTSADEIKEDLLKLLQGAHLPTDQKNRARQALSKVEDKFALLDVIKEDSFGAVYLYQDRVDHTLLVIKKQPNTSAGLKEAKLLTTLRHKNIVNILGTARNKQCFIIVMEYLSGGSLKDRLIRPLPWEDALSTVLDICEGLSFAHRNRIVHGNLKPDNILFTESGLAKITDLGLDPHDVSGEDAENCYNIHGEPKSPHADISAVGTIFYQMLTDSLPVWKDDQMIPHDSFKQLPAKLQEIVNQMLLPRQDTPYSSIDHVLVDMKELMQSYTERLQEGSESPTMHSEGIPNLLRRARRRLGWPLLALAILMATAVAYFSYIGNIKTYTDAISALWDKLGSYLMPIIGK